MKKIGLLTILFLIVCCKKTDESKTIIITSDQVKEGVTYLASDDLKGRETGTIGIDKAATYIENQLRNFGVKPYFETYRDSFKIKKIDAFNVVGFIEGNDDKLKNEVIIIGAHYDHIGYKSKSVENDSIGNGANDNATGTATVLAIAEYFAAKNNNKRSIMFALFSAEEMGLLGSKHLSKKLKDQNLDLYTMINFEMTGVPFPDRDYVSFVSGYDLSNIAEKINHYTSSNLIGFSDVSKKYNLFRASDNAPFYDVFNVPCHTISSCDLSNYDYYHHVDDEAEKMDYEHMASFINSLIPAIETMSNTPTKEIKIHE
ncbi:MAG: peptidase M28 [Bacteroidetes bacterium]|nr:MAG: peptidase M28 [Bacteroidota bacterium]